MVYHQRRGAVRARAGIAAAGLEQAVPRPGAPDVLHADGPHELSGVHVLARKFVAAEQRVAALGARF